MKYYLVGGTIRDRFLGLKSNKDFDFVVESQSYQDMKDWLISMGATIYVEKPEFLTIRCKFRDMDADFVCCRKDGVYSDGRRPDNTSIGSLYDDQSRRDFTVNSIAYDYETNEYIDPFGGVQDIRDGIIRCVGKSEDRMREDSLRLLRAIRFSITKNMTIHQEIHKLLKRDDIIELLANVSEDRIREEMVKMFSHNPIMAWDYTKYYESLFTYIFFHTNIWLLPTSENRR